MIEFLAGVELLEGRYRRNGVSFEGERCWLWRGYLDRDGYGEIVVEGQKWRAHRFVYTLYVGPIQSKHVLDHLCRHRACVHPIHTESVTQTVNVLRTPRCNVSACPQGHPYDEENTYYRPNGGSRDCRACRRDRAREVYQAMKAA
jgi:hypothetical protein